MKKVRIVVLAAGKGTRMESNLPKVLAPLKGKHMIKHLLESIDNTGIDDRPIIVVGYEKEMVQKELGEKYEYVVQEEQLGTGHAVLSAERASFGAEHILVISGDQPFIKTQTIKNLLEKHLNSKAKITITTTELSDFLHWRQAFSKYGRIIRKDGKIIDREWRDATLEEKNIKEVNVSCYAFDAAWLWENLKKIDMHSNAQKEYYLTDLWEIAGKYGDKIESIQVEPFEALGANSKAELEILEGLAIQ